MKRNKNNANIVSVGGPYVTIVGDILAATDINVGGQVEGNVTSTNGVVILNARAVLHGNIKASTVEVIEATIRGNITADNVIIHSGSYITGDVKANTMTVDAGAVINGKCDITGESVIPSQVTEPVM